MVLMVRGVLIYRAAELCFIMPPTLPSLFNNACVFAQDVVRGQQSQGSTCVWDILTGNHA